MQTQTFDPMSSKTNGILVGPMEGREFAYQGGRANIKLSAADTGGALAVGLQVVGPGSGPPLHVHSSFDELFYILEGTFAFVAGEREFTVGAGATIYVPRGVPHRFHNSGASDGKMLGVFSPAGFEEWFLKIGEMEAAGTLTHEKMVALGHALDTHLCSEPTGGRDRAR